MSSRFDGPFVLVQAAVGWITLALALLSVIPQGGAQPIVWIFLSFGVLGLFAVQIVLSVLRPTAGALRQATPLAVLYAGVVAWCLVQVLLPVPDALAHPIWQIAPEGAAPRIGADPGQGAHIALRLATYGMIAWIMAASALNSHRAWSFLRVIGVFCTLLAIYAIGAALTQKNPLLGITSFGPNYTTGTFVSRNAFACYIAFGLFVNVALYLHMSGRGDERGGNAMAALRHFLENFFRGSWLYAVGTLFCGAALAMTQSRAGVGAGMLGLLVLTICVARRGRGSPLVLWGLLIGIGGFVVVMLGTATMTRLFAETNYGGRFVIYPIIVEHIMDRPWLGQGAGAFHDTFRAFVPAEVGQAEWDYAHNSYLENFYEFGIPAAAIFYLVLGLVFLRLIWGVRHRDADVGIPSLALAAMVTGGVHSLVDFPLQMPGATALFAVILGIGWAQSFTKEGRRSLTKREASNDI